MPLTAATLTLAIIVASMPYFLHQTHSPVAAADYILVKKRAHTLTLFERSRPIRTYRVSLGRGGLGPKVQQGDDRVPEGTYQISNHNPRSAFHRALRVSYPNAQQVLLAQQQHVNPGGDIMLHGIRNGLGWIEPLQRRVDWTAGCIAVTDPEIEEIYRAVPDGTTIEIRP